MCKCITNLYKKILKNKKMSQNAKLIIQTIKDSLGVKNDKEFCKILDIKQNTLSTWRKRDTLDFNKIISICETNNLDLNEVFFPENGVDDNYDSENVLAKESLSCNKLKSLEIKIIKKVNLVNNNKEVAFFKVQEDKVQSATHQIVIGQRSQLKKVKENSDLILVLKSNKVFIERVKRFSEGFKQVFFDSTLPESSLNSVFASDIKQVYINLGTMEVSGGITTKKENTDIFNQILLLENQIEHLKKKFKS